MLQGPQASDVAQRAALVAVGCGAEGAEHAGAPQLIARTLLTFVTPKKECSGIRSGAAP